MNILLVEDAPGLGEIITTILEVRGGHRVRLVENGDEALQVYKQRTVDYDLVLTDRSHPGMDGIELAAAIRKINPSQPIAFQTVHTTDPFIEQHIAKHGVHDVPSIEKPFELEQLLSFVESVAKGRPSDTTEKR